MHSRWMTAEQTIFPELYVFLQKCGAPTRKGVSGSHTIFRRHPQSVSGMLVAKVHGTLYTRCVYLPNSEGYTQLVLQLPTECLGGGGYSQRASGLFATNFWSGSPGRDTSDFRHAWSRFPVLHVVVFQLVPALDLSGSFRRKLRQQDFEGVSTVGLETVRKRECVHKWEGLEVCGVCQERFARFPQLVPEDSTARFRGHPQHDSGVPAACWRGSTRRISAGFM